MGHEIRPELPANSPRPPETPHEGIVVVDVDPDGYTRRYLYKAMRGSDPSEILISESPTMGVSGRATMSDRSERRNIPIRTERTEAPTRRSLPMTSSAPKPSRIPVTQMKENAGAPMLQVRTLMAPQMGATTPVHGLRREDAVRPQAPILTSTPIHQAAKVAATPLPERAQTQMLALRTAAPQMGSTSMVPQEAKEAAIPRTSMGGPTAFLEKEVRLMSVIGPSLGNGPKNGMIAAPSMGQTAPAPAPAPPGECPGAVEMPDGRVIQPEDGIALRDLCELMPFLLESYGERQKAEAGNGPLAPGKSVPIAGQPQSGPGAVPTSSQFGPAGGMGGGGGGGFVGGGGGGPGPAGPQGATGTAGVAGFGGLVDSISKIDGDFTAGPGAFIPVPGTLLPFVQAVAGPVTFLVNVSFGTTSGAGSTSQSGQMGLKVDGTDYPLVTRLIHTFVGGVAEFLVGQAAVFVLVLPAGAHTVEVITRGLFPGEFGGTGIGIPLTVSAVPIQPLTLSAVHS